MQVVTITTARHSWLAALAAAIATTSPLWGIAIPPLLDLPGHMGRWQIMLAPDAPMLAPSFDFRWRLVGNLAADLPMALLGPVLGLEPATWLLTAATVALTALALLRLSAKVHGAVQPSVLLSLPLAYAYPLQQGFLNFCLAQALALLALLEWLGPDRSRVRHWLIFAPVGLMLWIAHAMAWGLFGLAALGGSLAQRQSIEGARQAFSGAIGDCLPLALPILLLPSHDIGAPGLVEGWFLWSYKLDFLVSLFRDRWQFLDVGAVALLIVIPALLASRGGISFAPVLALPAVICGLAFVLLPFRILGSNYADMRVLPFAVMLALTAIRFPPETNWPARVVCGLFLAARLATVGVSFHGYDKDYRSALLALDHLPRNSSLLVIVRSACSSQWHLSRLQHLGALATVRRNAYTNDHFMMEAGQTLALRRRDVGPYRDNPSQIDEPPGCPNHGPARISTSLADFPRAGFDHVWTIDYAPRRSRPADLKVLWTDGRSTLYRVNNLKVEAPEIRLRYPLHLRRAG